MNQLLYGCQREYCDTHTCYTARKRLPRNSNASRRLSLLSARIIACNLASADDPLRALCPGKPVVPTLAGAKERGETEVGVVTDKGAKDFRSFTQMLFNTVAVKMVEWISIPPPPLLPSRRGGADERERGEEEEEEGEREPPKLKFPINPMDVVDSGRTNKDTEAVSQIHHQEILQQQSRRRKIPPAKDVTPTPHSNSKAKLTTPINTLISPPIYQQPRQQRKERDATAKLHLTPSRGEKNAVTTMLWPAAEPVATVPQSLKILNEDICKALCEMCTNPATPETEKIGNMAFAEQSVFYVLSTPEATLASFGGIGDGDTVGFDPGSVDRALDILYNFGLQEHAVRAIWTSLANVFTKPGRGLSDKTCAGIIVIAFHVLARGLIDDEEVFGIVAELRAAGKVSAGSDVAPDIGFEDELTERLMRRVLRAIDFRRAREGDATIPHLKRYLRRCEELHRKERDLRIAAEFGEKFVGLVNDGPAKGGTGLARCMLEWTRTVFAGCWNGDEVVTRNSLAGACVEMFKLLHADYEAYGLFPKLFETWMIGQLINPAVCPVAWCNQTIQTRAPDDIHLLDHPYLFSVPHRVTYFRAINLDTMKKAYEASIANLRMASQMSNLTKLSYPYFAGKIDTALSIYFVIVVRRTNLLVDALNQLVHREHRELLRPLKIRFAEGEEGVDQGGVQQEFFSLLIKEILSPEFGMFVTDERSRMSWFWEGSLESHMKFELVGLVIGLAVYNGITLPVNFPKVLYIKLLGGTPTLNDIGDRWSELAHGLKELLDWQDGDVADVFVRTYEYSTDILGQVYSVDMEYAKTSGQGFLPRPIQRARSPKNGLSFAQEMPWLPQLNPSEEWMGPLSRLLETIDAEEERLQRLRTGNTRYTVTYHDLNELNDNGEGGAEDGAGGETAAAGSRQDGPGRADLDYGLLTPQRSLASRPEEETDTDSPPSSAPAEGGDPSVRTADSGKNEDDGKPDGEGEEQPETETVPSDPQSVEKVEEANTENQPDEKPQRGLGSQSDQAEEEVSPHAEDELLQPQPPTSQHEAPLVTNANREAYVRDYISWLTSRSVHQSYTSFARGFHALLPPRSLQLFSPTTLQTLIEGSSSGTPLSITRLESVCKYEDGYHAGHPVIRDFWAVVHNFNEERRRQLLEFVTSSPRVPIGGLENIMFYIVRNGEDSERLPSSLTCFGRLLLPEYSSRKKLKRKLELALENSRGFGNP